MRMNILVLALLSSAVSAQASSIDVVKTGTDRSGSIEKVGCAECVQAAKKASMAVVELAPGTQKIEIRDVNGVKMVYRTEAWFGGSPVTVVSKALPDVPVVAESEPVKVEDVASTPEPITEQPARTADMIDEDATTSAVPTETGAEAKVEVREQAFDPGKLEFRTN